MVVAIIFEARDDDSARDLERLELGRKRPGWRQAAAMNWEQVQVADGRGLDVVKINAKHIWI